MPKASNEASDSSFVFSGPWVFTVTWEGWMRSPGFYPALEVCNVRLLVAAATLLKEGLAFGCNGGILASGRVRAGAHRQRRKQEEKETLAGHHILTPEFQLEEHCPVLPSPPTHCPSPPPPHSQCVTRTQCPAGSVRAAGSGTPSIELELLAQGALDPSSSDQHLCLLRLRFLF